PLSPRLLPPGRGDEVGAAALELPGEGDGGGPDPVAAPATFDAQVDVDAAVPGRLGPAGEAELRKDFARQEGRLPHHLEGDARRRVEVDAQLVGVVLIVRWRGPHVEA